ncbi:hypothetical protein WAE56_09645 [Iodobacter sp. LRB]|uniref:hypothetical protein n=1 Tax=unclassified Iodobacter TaxID=235634 RepID=UPI001179E61F|nr:hypothetical protein [Iodobacter sp. BJB302]
MTSSASKQSAEGKLFKCKINESNPFEYATLFVCLYPIYAPQFVYKLQHHCSFYTGHDMRKNICKISTIVLLATTAGTAVNGAAALPPKYLEIKDFKKCLKDKAVESYYILCMPDKKPAACPRASWKQLNALTANDKIPSCAPKAE